MLLIVTYCAMRGQEEDEEENGSGKSDSGDDNGSNEGNDGGSDSGDDDDDSGDDDDDSDADENDADIASAMAGVVGGKPSPRRPWKKPAAKIEDMEDEEDEEDDDEGEEGEEDGESESEDGSGDGSESGSSSSEDEGAAGEPEDLGPIRWKQDLQLKAKASYDRRMGANLQAAVYGHYGSTQAKQKLAAEDEAAISQSDDEVAGDSDAGASGSGSESSGSGSDADDGDDALFKVKKDGNAGKSAASMDTSRFAMFTQSLERWESEAAIEAVRNRFVTGSWGEDDAGKQIADHEQAVQEEEFGDFEDLETGEVHTAAGSAAAAADTAEGSDEEEGGSDADEDGEDGEAAPRRGINDSPMNPGLLKMQAKRLSKKAQFDSQYDKKTAFDEQKEAQAEQAAFNKSEFENEDEYTRVQLEGYRPGLYVRIELEDVPPELIDNFDPHYPLVLGGLLPSEMAMGYLQMRFKKHRWHKKILKTRDPLVISLGWRRFQTIPLFACHDRDARYRALKYTPEHAHCIAVMWGPVRHFPAQFPPF